MDRAVTHTVGRSGACAVALLECCCMMNRVADRHVDPDADPDAGYF